MPQEEQLPVQINPQQVYQAANLDSVVSSPQPAPSITTMKIEDIPKLGTGDLKKEIETQSNLAEQRQLAIRNQPVQMGVLTGQAAHQARLDTAYLGALNRQLDTKLFEEEQKRIKRQEEEAKKEKKRQSFINEWGVDPSTRPKGMSKQEFAESLRSQGVVPRSQYEREAMALDLAGKRKSLAGGSATSLLQSAGANLQRGEGGFVDGNVYQAERDRLVRSAQVTPEEFDAQYGYLLSPGDQEKFQVSGGGGSVDYWTRLLESGQATVSNVPTDIRNEVVSRAAELGTGVNKQLSDSAIKEITQTQSALSGLDNLARVIQGNEQYIGPITGLQVFNPFSKARQIQADVDRVRQVVGKALEGGVLRKEDEEKYKKILATLADTPETALYKIEALRSDLERNIADYKAAQAGAGRYVEGFTNTQPNDIESLRNKYNY